jgi:hypothetical protein
VVLKKIPCKAILNKKNNWGKKYPAPLFGGEKMLQNSMGCRDRFDQSKKISWLDFQGLV